MVEGARLESVFRGNSNVGSNPTLSASFPPDADPRFLYFHQNPASFWGSRVLGAFAPWRAIDDAAWKKSLTQRRKDAKNTKNTTHKNTGETTGFPALQA